MKTDMQPIRIENLTVKYQDKVVLDNLSLTLPPRGCVCFFGPSGSGKTTLLRAIAGLTKPAAGKISMQKTKMAYVFQENRLIPWLTAQGNVALVLGNDVHTGKDSASETAKKWLNRVGLGDALDKFPSQLSGGMRQRVNLARALAFDAPVLLLDEPFKELDETIKAQIITLFQELKKDRLLLLVTHDKEDARLLADQMVYIS